MTAKNRSLINNLTEGPLVRQLVSFAIPAIIGHILQSCYTIADMAIVGKFIGADGLSAVGIGGILQNLVLMVGMGMGLGGQIVLSQQVGIGDKTRIKKVIGSFMTLTISFAVLFGGLGLLLTDWLIDLLNTPAGVVAQTKNYYLVCCFGIVFIYGYNAVGSVLRGLGEAKLPSVFIAIAAALNILLDFLFIAVFHMDVEGAALATVIAQGISFLISIGYLWKNQSRLYFEFKPENFHPDRQSSVAIIKVAAPMVAYSLAMSITAMFINSNVNVFGIAASAVDGIGSKINMVIVSITTGVYTGGAAIIGQCFGAGKMQRIRKAYYAATGLSLLIWAVIGAGMVLLAEPIFSVFTSDPQVLAMAGQYMLVDLVYFLGMALSTGPFALLDGVAATGLEMIIGMIESLLVKVICALVLSQWFGLYGYWLGNSIGALTTPVLTYIYFLSGAWAKRKTALR